MTSSQSNCPKILYKDRQNAVSFHLFSIKSNVDKRLSDNPSTVFLRISLLLPVGDELFCRLYPLHDLDVGDGCLLRITAVSLSGLFPRRVVQLGDDDILGHELGAGLGLLGDQAPPPDRHGGEGRLPAQVHVERSLGPDDKTGFCDCTRVHSPNLKNQVSCGDWRTLKMYGLER